MEQAKFVVEPKIDGLSVVLHYRDGLFVQGATRGDGEIGEDITSNLRTIRAIPLKIPVDSDQLSVVSVPKYLVVRGEAFIPNKDFEELNRKLEEAGEKTYLNPRNTAAGSLRQLDPQLTASRPLTLLVYQIVYFEGGKVPNSQWEILEYLKALGFPVTDMTKRFNDLDSAIAYTETWNEGRDTLDYEADGMVIKIDDLTLAADLGFVGKDPRGAIAFKFPAREVTTTLNDIGVAVGRTGVLTPYAMLEPVEIGGVVVERATLHNFDFIAEKDIRVGDRVLVKRAGEVIPYVIGPVVDARSGKEKSYKPPDEMSRLRTGCGTLRRRSGVVLRQCGMSRATGAEHRAFCLTRRDGHCRAWGSKIVEKLIETGKIKDAADIYTLKKRAIFSKLLQEGKKDQSRTARQKCR